MPKAPDCRIEEIPAPRYAACRAILLSLPEWFGIPEHLESYAKDTDNFPTLGAYSHSGELLGFLTLHQHNPFTADIHAIAVSPRSHGQGIGSLLVEHAERTARALGCELLMVKTLGPSKPDPFYDRTRSFYLKAGFRPLEELSGVWGENPCLVMVKPLAR